MTAPSFPRPAERPPASRVVPCVAGMGSLFVFAVSANALPAVVLRAAGTLAVTPERLATVASAQFAGFFLATVVGGFLCDRFGKKHVLQAASLLLLAGAVCWTAADRLAIAYLAGTLMGMGGGVLESMSSALLADLFPHRRKLALNLSQTFFCAGAVGGPWAMAELLPRGVPWQSIFAAIAVGGGLLFVLYSWARLPAPATAERITLQGVRAMAGRKAFLLPCAALFCYVLSESCVAIFANLFLRKYRGAPEAWAIYGISLMWLAMLAGRTLCAFLPERASYEKALTALFLLSAAALAAQGGVAAWPWSLVLFALAGFFFAGTWPLLVGLAAARTPARTGTAVGLTVAVGALGVVAAPPFMRFVLAHASADAAFTIAAVPLLVGAGLMAAGSRWRRGHEKGTGGG